MKSSESEIEATISVIKHTIEQYASAKPLRDADTFKAILIAAWQIDGNAEQFDVLPSMINKSSESRALFRALQRIAADYINNYQMMPPELAAWLKKTLRHELEEPKAGRKGPNASLWDNVFMLQLVAMVKRMTGLPIWPSHTHEKYGNVLSIIALASSAVKRGQGSSPLPTTVTTIEKRYKRARASLFLKGKNPQ